MFYRHDTRIISYLFNVYSHLQKNYDFLLIVAGDTGTGKSMFVLQLLETWYRVVLGREVDKKLISHVNVDFKKWVQNFKFLEPYEVNVFDEGSTALDSKEYMSSLSKKLSKMFYVNRYKKLFSIVVLPNFFTLNKNFRENRLRGLVHVNKRGEYRLFTKKGVTYLNAFNESRLVKSMFVARPFHSSVFPDYEGVLRKPYDKMAREDKDKVIDEIVADLTAVERKSVTYFDIYGDRVQSMLGEDLSINEIGRRLKLPAMTVSRIVKELRINELVD